MLCCEERRAGMITRAPADNTFQLPLCISTTALLWWCLISRVSWQYRKYESRGTEHLAPIFPQTERVKLTSFRGSAHPVCRWLQRGALSCFWTTVAHGVLLHWEALRRGDAGSYQTDDAGSALHIYGRGRQRKRERERRASTCLATSQANPEQRAFMFPPQTTLSSWCHSWRQRWNLEQQQQQ